MARPPRRDGSARRPARALGGRQGEDVTVVFEQPPRPPIRSTVIEVAHAKRARANSADDEIVRLIAAGGDAHDVRVVTSDGWLADQVRAAGGSVEPALAFRNGLD